MKKGTQTSGILKFAGVLLLVAIYISGVVHSRRYHQEDDRRDIDRYGLNAMFRGVEWIWHRH